MDGDLIGINTAIFSRTGGSQGIGFAIPSNIAQHIVSSLIQTGSVVRGWLGVSIQDMTPTLAEAFGLQEMKGALIGQVLAGSPAEKSGLKQGDIIVQYAGKPIDNVSQIRNAAAQSQVGTGVNVTVIRDGQEHTIQVIVAVRPADLSSSTRSFSGESEDLDNVLADLRVRDLDLETLERLDLPSHTSGVLVEAVRPNSPADREGMRQGDIIQQIRFAGIQIPITNMTDFQVAARKIGKDDMIILLVQRQGGSLFIPLQP
jgi:serine protease Do